MLESCMAMDRAQQNSAQSDRLLRGRTWGPRASAGGARSLGRSAFRMIPLEGQDSGLDFDAVGVLVQGAGGVDDAVARVEQGDGVASHCAPDRAGRGRLADLLGDPAVRAHLARRGRRGGAGRRSWAGGELADVDLFEIGTMRL